MKRLAQGSVMAVTAVFLCATSAPAQELTEQGMQQIRAILAEKAARTPAQRKLATSLLYARRERAGQAMVQGLGPLRRVADRAGVDRDGMVVVDIRADVTDGLLQTIARVGGRVALAYPAFGAVRARVPIRQVEAIASLPEVRSISPRQGFLVNTGSRTSQGDAAHAAASARTTYGIDGTGVRVGVLSDGVDTLAARQASGDLPPTCPQAGACVQVVQECDLTPYPGTTCGGEGTAMLEIVHDLAPGAKLYFATAVDSDASFAANILALKNTYGCDIIVDDVTYFNEGAFQDGVIAQAVNTVKAAGVLYFSSAGNSGRLTAGTSGTWEGDFVDSGTTIAPITTFYGSDLPIHSFNGLTGGSAANSDQLTASAPFAISLKWSDPLGGATTDYDIFILDSGLATVFDVSADIQSFTHEPLEIMGPGFTQERIVVVLLSGPTKALHLDTNRGRLTLATAGAVVGHNGGESSISVAATDGRIPGAGNPFVGGATNPVETYSSDGPRRIFYDPDGSAITPGNILFGTAGGRNLQKPDITAADCVVTTTPGFSPFCGTSAAAPHAAAIAALLLSASPAPAPAAVAAAMAGTALDVNPTGWDRESGNGIPMADRPQAVTDVAVGMAGPAGVLRGADAVYTITVTDNGLGGASSVQVANPTPAGITFVSNTGDCTIPFPCSLGSLATGETRTITATFNVPADYSGPSPFTPTATVSSPTPDPILVNNSSSVSTAVGQADLSIGKTGPASVVRGANVAYTITVSNAGPDAADSVEVTDPTPAGLTFVSNTGDCATVFPCSLATVPAGATRTITATFGVPPAYSGPSPFTNTATVSSATIEPVPGNNSANAITTVTEGTGLFYYTLTPCRLVDTRTPGQTRALQPGEVRTFLLAGPPCGIPVGATALSVNVTVSGATAPGNVRLYPADVAVPQVSTLNFKAGVTRANNAIVPASADGSVAVSVKNASVGTVHFILDVNGYFE